MPKVCVIGCGTAGREAATEAVSDGAAVTVLEKNPRPDPPWRTWPALISEASSDPGPPAHEIPPEAELVFAEAKSAGAGLVRISDGTTARFDAVVVATGSAFSPMTFSGHRKLGVRVLDSASAYSDLGSNSGSMARLVISGEGARALQVAERLSASGRNIQAVIPHWRHGAPSGALLEVLKEAASNRGVSTTVGRLDRAVGEGLIEGAVVDGQVLRCDTLVVLPHRVPRVVPSQAHLGRAGGLVVDDALRTSLPAVLAAGGSAELQSCEGRACTLEEEPGPSGRIAGANSTGMKLHVGPFVRSEFVAFGVRWCRVGARVRPEERPQLSLGTVAQRRGPESACMIIYERLRGRVLSVESVRPTGGPLLEASELLPGVATLRSLAYESSSDISLVSDTARLGLSRWSNS